LHVILSRYRGEESLPLGEDKLISAETRQWLAKADKDFGTALFAIESVDGPLLVTTGLHCQQSAEKYLKAYLQEMDISFSEHQILTSLFEHCVEADASFETLQSEISQLEGYSIAARYPTAKDIAEFNRDAMEAIRHIKEFVLSKFD
jgi:HEPN domain-containing protein